MLTRFFHGSISEGSVKTLLEELEPAFKQAEQLNGGDGMLRLVIVSEGGELDMAFHAYDMLRLFQEEYNVKLLTVASGICYSSAVVLLQAGQERYALPHTTFMLHSPYQVAWEDERHITRRELTERMSVLDTTRDMLVDLLVERTQKTWNEWQYWLDTDTATFISTRTACYLNLIDEVIPLLPVPQYAEHEQQRG